MQLTLAQKQALKADINASEVAGEPNNDTGNAVILAAYNALASPDYWVWRTSVSRADVYNAQNDLTVSGAQTGFWSWTTYKNQGATEQNAWVQMFMGDLADFSKKNLRDGVTAIFTGSAQATAQRDHVLAIGRRLATRCEKLFSVDTPGSGAGRGTAADPDTLTLEGLLTLTNIEEARNS